MTLNVTLFGNDWVAQAADRRISGPGGSLGDQNKAVVFMSDGLRASVVFAGLANHPESKLISLPMGGPSMDFQSTDVWLTEVLGENDLRNVSSRELAEAVRTAAELRWRDLPDDWAAQALLITIAGWDVATGKPFGHLITNCLDAAGQQKSPDRSFRSKALHTERCYIVGWIDDDGRKLGESALHKVIRRNRKKTESIDAIVGIIRRAAREPDKVSPDPVVVWLPREGQATAHYCPPDLTPWQFPPSFVYCTSQGGYASPGGFAFGNFDPGDRIIMGDPRTPHSVTMTPNPKPKVTKP